MVVQGVLSVVVADLELLLGWVVLYPACRALCVALVMAALSPIMMELGVATTEKEANDEYREGFRE